MVTFLLATGNRHKVRELKRLLKGVPVRWVGLDRFPGIRTAREDGTTFQANAVKKAVAVSRQTILPVLAEDSGLVVPALKGQPGVRSARFAGKGATDQANVKKLLNQMHHHLPSRRHAKFVCCMVLAMGGRPVKTFQASTAGSIAHAARGGTGFGYDPVFIPRGYRKTFAELGAGTKDQHSHRAKAAARLREWLKRALPKAPAGS